MDCVARRNIHYLLHSERNTIFGELSSFTMVSQNKWGLFLLLNFQGSGDDPFIELPQGRRRSSPRPFLLNLIH